MTWALGGWAFGVGLQSLLDETTMVHAQGAADTWDHLGDDTDTRNTRMAEIVNRAIEEYLENNPALGRSTHEITLVAGTQAYAIPSDLARSQIERVRIKADSSEPVRGGLELAYLPPGGETGIPITWRNDAARQHYPVYWGFDATRENIRIYPSPGAALTLEVVYRPAPTAITAANVATPGVTSISEVPTRHQRVLALRVAAELVESSPGNAELSERLYGRYRGALEQAVRDLGRTLTGGGPRPGGGLINTRHFFGGMSPWTR